jgi:HlyD family secretion protein
MRPNPADRYRFANVSRGDVTVLVTATGNVQPVQSVQVGAFVSGPIQKVCVDFNSRVKAGELMAVIDARTYKATVEREEATLAHAKADVARVQALLDQALSNEKRVVKLRATKKTFVSESEFEQVTTDRKSLEAQLALSKAVVRQADASLATAVTNLEFTQIKSPVDGIVIDRKVDSGQTLASQFQTPVMFVVSPDLEKKVYVYASIDEADIGLVRDVQDKNRPVLFTVDAYPNTVYTGKVVQCRLNPNTIQNVVTYTVVIEAPNKDLKLLPGMTANLAFLIEKRSGVIRIPNSALRYTPSPSDLRPEDRGLLEEEDESSAGSKKSSVAVVAASIGLTESSLAKRVWIFEDGHLKPIAVKTGLSDSGFTELISGDVEEGKALVAGLRMVNPAAQPAGAPD